jgi:hypothetical protein
MKKDVRHVGARFANETTYYPSEITRTTYVHIFAFSDFGIVFDATADFVGGSIDSENGQDETPISHQYLLSRLDTFAQFRIRTRELATVPLVVIIGSENDRLTFGETDFAQSVGKESTTNKIERTGM